MSKKITLYDVIEENFQQRQWKASVCRAIYAGDHDIEDPRTYFQHTVKQCNSSYCDVIVNGLALIYPKSFVFILEGSEDTLNRQISLLLESSDIKNAKLLMMFENRNTKWFKNFDCIYVCPENVKTTDHPENNSCKDLYAEKLRSFVENIHEICKLVTENRRELAEVDLKSNIVPDEATLHFFLNSDIPIGLGEYIELTENLPPFQYPFEEGWPAPYDFTPRLIDKSKVKTNFVKQLPTE